MTDESLTIPLNSAAHFDSCTITVPELIAVADPGFWKGEDGLTDLDQLPHSAVEAIGVATEGSNGSVQTGAPTSKGPQ